MATELPDCAGIKAGHNYWSGRQNGSQACDLGFEITSMDVKPHVFDHSKPPHFAANTDRTRFRHLSLVWANSRGMFFVCYSGLNRLA